MRIASCLEGQGKAGVGGERWIGAREWQGRQAHGQSGPGTGVEPGSGTFSVPHIQTEAPQLFCFETLILLRIFSLTSQIAKQYCNNNGTFEQVTSQPFISGASFCDIRFQPANPEISAELFENTKKGEHPG